MRIIHRSLRALLGLGLASCILGFSPAYAHGGGSHGGGGGHGHPGHMGGHSFGINYSPGIFFGYGPFGFYPYSPPLLVVSPGGLAPFLAPVFVPQPVPVAVAPRAPLGPMLPMPPRELVDQNAPRARRSNPARAKELVEVGDRSFRGSNIHRAEEKYNLAVKADPTAPTPHVHLAQVSLARGDYAAAADHLRDAVTVAADAGWLLNVPDIQSMFAEPADFSKQLARLESHLQANPNDRDAWFVLGAEWYLSGRSKQASDVFQRLNDRKPDEALAAFMDASKPKAPAAAN